MAVVKQTDPPLALRGVDSGLRNGAHPRTQVAAAVGPWTIPVKTVPYAHAKRALDITITLAALLIGLPLFLFISLLVKLTSRGPVIFRQTRVGVGGRCFTCYKFRSMCEGAESQQIRLMGQNEASGPVFKIKEDPRMTPIGRFLRKFSFDELPQFINVLKGDMSIVGPRPPVPYEVDNYTAHQFGRLAVRPGLTCLWQISGRSDIPFDKWVELDLQYIETMSFWNDVRILVKTVPAVITGRGAC